ncbi:DUF2254 domain-containing protein (plasmid) [Rhodobacteraceae bacterium SC52]|nr:DUF2254 domain-containing protein [Rhodobacteraceae bacterium SC52]
MISRQIWKLRTALRKIWVRVVAFAVLAAASIVLAKLLAPLLPEGLAFKTGAESVERLLNLLASSMLAVTTFSLSIAVSAFSGAAQNATPRAIALLQQDRTTQNVLATFLGAFLYSLLGIIALSAGLYDSNAQVILFFVTIAVTGLVIVALMRWIGHLMSFGRMGNTLDRVELAAKNALARWRTAPNLGGHPINGDVPAGGAEVLAKKSGYVQHVDMPSLNGLAEKSGAQIFIDRRPGGFVANGQALCSVHGSQLEADDRANIQAAFSIGTERVFEEDPRFGLIVLSEIASRALSPAVNDPGTAISVIGRIVRLLSDWPNHETPEICFPQMHVPRILAEDMLVDALRPVARDGADNIEVQVRLQKALASLRSTAPDDFEDPAARLACEALERANRAGLPDSELTDLYDIAAWARPKEIAPHT